ncbi:uncharacterized protein CEXT_563671 [Caerostris extrusa]|uniref:Uncharacterized protein n=1 Tax=Caerostris extrusa TaxID=172846 RepID=A0AAV4T760_CAEEX|nr:uncharacterized protein CEXT_563671 [Caerostris extrusa]
MLQPNFNWGIYITQEQEYMVMYSCSMPMISVLCLHPNCNFFPLPGTQLCREPSKKTCTACGISASPPKGVINWGDSFRSHSLTSVPGLDPFPSSSSQWDVASTKSYPMTASNSHWNCGKVPQRYSGVRIF